MKNVTVKLTITMALAALATGIASAQSLYADVPFAFRAGKQMLPAGSYQVRMIGVSNEIVVLQNYDARRAVVLLPSSQASDAKGDARLTFECGAARCSLTQLSIGFDSRAFTFRHRTPARDEQAVLTEIRLVKSE
jgi:hypothetical protein